MSIFLAAITAIRHRLTGNESDKRASPAVNGRPASPTVASDEAEPLTGTDIQATQWQILYEKIVADNGGPSPAESEVNELLLSVFREHILARNPEFAKYFKGEARGRAMEDRVLHKAWQEAAALGIHDPGTPASTTLATSGPPRPSGSGAKPRKPRPWDPLARALARYRCWRPRVQVYLTLSKPDYNPLAFCLGLFLMAVIVLNTVTFCMESVPHWESSELLDRLAIVDYVCLGIFTVEFLLRLATCSSFRRFATTFMNWVDLAAILPFYIELAVLGPDSSEASQTRIVRLVRLLRVLRLLRATSRFRNLQIVVDALVGSLDVIAMLAVLLLVLLVVSGTIIYYVEGALVENTWFDSIPLTIYYMHVTLTTTGYGDYYAQSAWGRFVAGVFMLLCMVTLSLPIGVVGGNFSALWGRYSTLRDSADRAASAWATRARLRELATRQCAALDNLMGTAGRVKVSLEDGSPGGLFRDPDLDLEEGVKALRDRLVALQLRIQLAAEGGQDPGKVAELLAAVTSLRSRLKEAGDRYMILHNLLSVGERLSAPDLREQLDSIATVHKEMAAWAGGGAVAVGQARDLLAELRALRAVVQAEEEQSEAAATALAKKHGAELEGSGKAGAEQEGGKEKAVAAKG